MEGLRESASYTQRFHPGRLAPPQDPLIVLGYALGAIAG
jgi:hypothetical protein